MVLVSASSEYVAIATVLIFKAIHCMNGVALKIDMAIALCGSRFCCLVYPCLLETLVAQKQVTIKRISGMLVAIP